MRKTFRILAALLLLALAFSLFSCSFEDVVNEGLKIAEQVVDTAGIAEDDDYGTEHGADWDPPAAQIGEDGVYDSRDDVALYVHTYGRLPSNYITKKEAEALGWSGGSLEKYAPGKCIGGDRFGNYEDKLPSKSGRTWTECDIDTLGASSRGAKRLVFSNDGLIYYTGDHYESFELLYGGAD